MNIKRTSTGLTDSEGTPINSDHLVRWEGNTYSVVWSIPFKTWVGQSRVARNWIGSEKLSMSTIVPQFTRAPESK